MSEFVRNPYSIHPMYGLVGFSIADLPSGFNSGFVALTAVTTDTTSSAINFGGNGLELDCHFSIENTSCSIDVINANTSAVIKTFNNVTGFNAGGLFVGFFDDRILLGGVPVQIRAYNITNSGAITINLRKTA